MQNRRYAKRHTRKNGRPLIVLIAAAVCIAAIILGIALGIKSCKNSGTDNGNTDLPSNTEQEKKEPEKPTEPYVVATAKVGSTGDIILHSPFIDNYYDSATKSYNYTSIFQYVKPYYEKYDWMVSNLEVTLGGTAAGAYRGYPVFNSPDSIVDAAISGGITMFLTANNHTYDTGYNGMIRTVQVLKQKNMPYIGTRETADEPTYTVKDINGIKIGMACYTYETKSSVAGRKALNGNVLKAEAGPLVNSFDYNNLEAFYKEVQSVLQGMKEQGAMTTIFYIHWGEEYQLKPNTYQKKIAQKLCDMGIDVIVGGHPHVIQPFETLKSADGHETICIYSTGNSVSNQRQNIMVSEPTGHTEDGLILETEYQLYSDGKLKISDVNILPTWVNLITSGKRRYYIIPLKADEDWSKFNLNTYQSAVKSFNRTMELVGPGLNEYRLSHGMTEVQTVRQ